jgi:hypothetical protein
MARPVGMTAVTEPSGPTVRRPSPSSTYSVPVVSIARSRTSYVGRPGKKVVTVPSRAISRIAQASPTKIVPAPSTIKPCVGKSKTWRPCPDPARVVTSPAGEICRTVSDVGSAKTELPSASKANWSVTGWFWAVSSAHVASRHGRASLAGPSVAWAAASAVRRTLGLVGVAAAATRGVPGSVRYSSCTQPLVPSRAPSTVTRHQWAPSVSTASTTGPLSMCRCWRSARQASLVLADVGAARSTKQSPGVSTCTA